MLRSCGASGTRRLTEQQASVLLREWKKELPLRDWTINIEITPDIAPLHGHVRIFETKLCASIRLLHPSAANSAEVDPLDMEVALVHELYHVVLIWLPSGAHEDIVQEQAIHKLSKQAVAMKRELRTLRRRTQNALPNHR